MPFFAVLSAQAAYQEHLALAEAQRRHLEATSPRRQLLPGVTCQYCKSTQAPAYRCRHCGAPIPPKP